MKIKKKGQSGAATQFVTRNQALRKLQIPLVEFRRLCILKGIYPREPNNRKKVNKGSSAHRTFYYTKDIAFLMHEPLLQTIRDSKVFQRKLAKSKYKQEWTAVDRLLEHKPQFTMDHLVKERYPSFVDALRDLDDALSMIFLFAVLPIESKKVHPDVITKCQQLASEFQHIIMRTHALRKTFVSIKGVYYQVEVRGQTITWVMPHQFTQKIPNRVDLKVMMNFLDFYQVLLAFVNYKLYRDLGLEYPPKLDHVKYEKGAGLAAFELHKLGTAVTVAMDVDTPRQHETSENKELLSTLPAKIAEIADRHEDDKDVLTGVAQLDITEMDEMEQEFLAGNTSASYATMFRSQVVYCSREVPLNALHFILRSCGTPIIGWDATVAGGSPLEENDDRITIQIVDRPLQQKRFLNRLYVQPQWVFDSINAGKLLDVDTYALGKELPPHLSPFVVYNEGDYNPKEMVQFTGEMGSDPEIDMNGEAEGDEYQRELEAEAAGQTFSTAATRKSPRTKSKISYKEQEEDDKKEMASIMMSKKQKNLYTRIQKQAQEKQADVDNLKRKKQVTLAKQTKKQKK
jgi:pescadillo protein